MKSYQDEPVKNLPDAYRKDKESNNFKILEVERVAVQDLRDALSEVEKVLDINNAYGKTLDLYGERIGQSRGAATDDQYLIMLKAKIMQNISNGSYKSVVDSICYMLSCDPSAIYIAEKEEPCVVEIVSIPLEIIIASGFSTSQITQIIKQLLPVGISVETVLYEGTFEFSDEEYEAGETSGFSEAEGGEIGGYFGMTGSDENETILPI